MSRTVSVSEVSGGYKATVRITVELDDDKQVGAGSATASSTSVAIEKANKLAEAALGFDTSSKPPGATSVTGADSENEYQ